MNIGDEIVDNNEYVRTQMAPAPATPPTNSTAELTPMSEKELLTDPEFQHHARVMYQDYMNSSAPTISDMASRHHVPAADKRFLQEGQDIAQWAIDQVSFMNNNLTKMGIDYSRLRNKSPQMLQSMMHVWDKYDDTPITTRQVVRGTAQMMADPLTWFGVGAIAKVAGKGIPKQILKAHMREMVKKAIPNVVPTMAVGAAEGAVAAGAYATTKEALQSGAEQRGFDWSTPMVYSATGAAIGSGLGLVPGAASVGLKYTHNALKQKYRFFRGHNKNSMLETQNPTGSMAFSETPDEAAQYGKNVSAVEVEPGSPVVLDKPPSTLELEGESEMLGKNFLGHFEDQLDLSKQEMKVITAEYNAKLGDQDVTRDYPGDMRTDILLQTPSFNEALRNRGFDMVTFRSSPVYARDTGGYPPAKLSDGEVVHHVLDPDIIKTARQTDLPVPLGHTPTNSQFSIAKSGAAKGEVKAAQKEWIEKGTESKYFKRWSNNAPVIENAGAAAADEFTSGAPVVAKVYHGSMSSSITEFKDELLGSNTSAVSARKGHFFAGNPATANASYYTGANPDALTPDFSVLPEEVQNDIADMVTGDLDVIQNPDSGKFYISGESEFDVEILDEFDTFAEAQYKMDEIVKGMLHNDVDFFNLVVANTGMNLDNPFLLELAEPVIKHGARPTVYEMYVKMDNPFVYDYEGAHYGAYKGKKTYSEVIGFAKDNGYDGAILVNTSDGGPRDNIFVSFKPQNIKSSMQTGLFDPMNRNIMYGTGAAPVPFLKQEDEDDRRRAD